MSKVNKKPIPLTKKDFFEIEECKCGKSPFKYHNTSKNEFIAKCNAPTEEYDIKLKKWGLCKKQPCDFFYAYYGERPIFEEIKLKLIKRADTLLSPDKVLAEKLKLLFQFLMVSEHSSTLDEINILVKNNLKREPRLVYYSPTTDHFMPIVGYESFDDYRERIFSKKIIDREENFAPTTPKQEPVIFVNSPFLERKSASVKSASDASVKSGSVKSGSVKVTKSPKLSKFIIVSGDEVLSENDEDKEEQSDNESESSRELSDYEDNAAIIEEEVFEEELYDDCDDDGGGDEDYDD